MRDATPPVMEAALAARAVTIPVGGRMLDGNVAVPVAARGLIVFPHARCSSRHGTSDRHLARALEARGFATVRCDLLTDEESRLDAPDQALRYDVHLLVKRLAWAAEWLKKQPHLSGIPVGFLASGPDAAVALIAAAQYPELVGALVLRAGRPDVADEWLTRLRQPTLLVVGGADAELLDLSRTARARMPISTHVAEVPGATHLLHERAALDEVGRLAGDWFVAHLPRVQ